MVALFILPSQSSSGISQGVGWIGAIVNQPYDQFCLKQIQRTRAGHIFWSKESSFQTSLTSQCAPWHPFCLSSLSTPPAHSHTPASFGWLSLTLWMGLLPAPWCWGLFPTCCLKRVDPLTHQRPKIPWLINKLPIELRWQIYGKPNLRKTCICIYIFQSDS